jgi:hypothetical protein
VDIIPRWRVNRALQAGKSQDAFWLLAGPLTSIVMSGAHAGVYASLSLPTSFS